MFNRDDLDTQYEVDELEFDEVVVIDYNTLPDDEELASEDLYDITDLLYQDQWVDEGCDDDSLPAFLQEQAL